MSRQIVDMQGLTKLMPFTTHQVYKYVRARVNPLPHKKAGKKLLFDMQKVYRWFDSLPGRDETFEEK